MECVTPQLMNVIGRNLVERNDQDQLDLHIGKVKNFIIFLRLTNIYVKDLLPKRYMVVMI